MSVFKTRIEIGDGITIHPCFVDTISWRGQLWLVPKWQPGKTAETRQPVRLVRPELFAFEHPVEDTGRADYYLTCVVPRTILDGRKTSGESIVFDIVEAPEVEFPIPKKDAQS